MRILIPLLAIAVATTSPQPIQDAPRFYECAPPDSDQVLVAHLRTLAVRYHPEALTPAQRNEYQVVAFIIDERCTVLHHGTMRRAANHLTVDSTMGMLFPTAKREPFLVGGIADLGPQDPRAKGAPWLVWLMIKS